MKTKNSKGAAKKGTAKTATKRSAQPKSKSKLSLKSSDLRSGGAVKKKKHDNTMVKVDDPGGYSDVAHDDLKKKDGD